MFDKECEKKLPQEPWIGMKHNKAHLKVFCCVTHAHVPDELRKKLDNKGQKCISVGYSKDKKTYKLMILLKEGYNQSRCSICGE